MKHISLIAGVVLLTGVGFASCSDEHTPRVKEPTEFVLNTPPMANYTYDLYDYRNSTIDLTFSQANYGVGVIPTYYVQVSLTGSFTQEYDKETKTGDYSTLYGSFNSASIEVPAYMFCVSLTQLKGYDDESEFVEESYPVYVRVLSTIPYWDGGTIASNVVELKDVRPYYAERLPQVIYLIGAPQGWDINGDTMPLSEAADAIGSNIYYGTYEISAADAKSGFRFYTELGDWGSDGSLPSIGAAAEDSSNEVEVEDGIYEGACVAGKGNWNISNWPGGNMKMTVDLNSMSVSFELVQ